MELNRMFKYRNIWIGTAMLWILFFHSGFGIGPQWLQTVKSVGYGGVDICLFASGMGCYMSLEKDPDILNFLKRRQKRLGPTWLCFVIPWLCWKNMVTPLPASAVLGNILGVQTLVSWEYHFNWYIGGLVIYYLSMPYLKRLTDSCSAVRQDILTGVALAVAGIAFWDSGNAIVILSRLPVLYWGMACGKMARQNRCLSRRECFAAVILAVAGTVVLLLSLRRLSDYLWSRGLYWYPFALMVPGMCLCLSMLAEQMEKYGCLRWINRTLETVGVYSFELYLVHLFLYEGLMPYVVNRFSYIPNNLLWLATLPVVICGTYLLNRIVAAVSKLLTCRSKKA